VELSDRDYGRLLEFRTELRRFLRWSEAEAEAAGITPAQHQLILAVRGHADVRGPTIGEVAGYLLLRHHSTVELVNRAEAARLVRRVVDRHDRRIIRLQLTAPAKRVLALLAATHLEEIRRLTPRIQALHDDRTDAPNHARSNQCQTTSRRP
jgi:DNA-binding MarR family transcriptional regulator